MFKVTTNVDGKTVTLETGRLAKQADGSVVASCGNNIVLVTAVSSKRPSDADFFPMTVEYQEKFYSTGKIPGGYFRREGKPTELAVLNARIIDRPIRPMFPEGYNFETQLVAIVLSSDGEFPVETLASIGASAALHISDVPFNGPTGAVRVGRVDGRLIANPTPKELETGDMNIMVAGTRNGILMVEGEAKFVSEADALEALKFAHASIIPFLDMQDKLRKECGSVPKREFVPRQIDPEIRGQAEKILKEKVYQALRVKEKQKRYEALDGAFAAALEIIKDVPAADREKFEKDLKFLFEDQKYKQARAMILDDKVRIDGRNTTQIRPIWCEVGMLPRTHGSGIFTRGETQVLATVTLGTPDDEQMIDALHGTVNKRFLLHYNFPPFSVGEVGRMGGQSRREIGHGYLAERSLSAILPDQEKFPYTVRIVSEVLESNGSSSMGTVCSGTLALLDAGVPITGNVAGIAMGLIKEGDRVAILSDILGDEDHLGDMDFKVAGTREGITAFQMDIKIDSVSFAIMEKALAQAKEGRNHILGEMEKTMSTPRNQLSEYAPRIETIQVRPEKVKDIIGAGGKVIKEIIQKTGVKIDIEDDGTVHIAATDAEARKKAIEIIKGIAEGAEVGKVYKGTVEKITDFGAFVEIMPNTTGLLHISEIAHERIRSVTDVLKEGDVLDVKVLDVDRAGRIKLSRKVLLEK